MGIRTILVIIAIAAIFLILRQMLGRRNLPGNAPKRLPDHMVCCARCGLHIPKTEALTTNGRYYCCTAHRDEDT